MIILWILGGFVAGAAYVVLAGILEVQISGALSGGVYDLNNVLVAVTGPQIPFLQYASLAVLSSLILIVATRRPLAERVVPRVAFFGSFAAATLVLIVWGFALQSSVMAATGGAREGLPEGLSGWVLKGGLSVVVHAVALVVATTAISITIRLRNTDQIGPSGVASMPDEVSENLA